MTTKKNQWSWVWVVIVWFFIMANYPFLIPFLVFWFIFYFLAKNKWKTSAYKSWGLEKSKIYESLMNSDFIKNQKKENPEFFKSIEEKYIKAPEKSKYQQSSLRNRHIENKVSQSKIIRPEKIKLSNYPKSKIQRKPYKSSFSTKMKKGKTYDYNDWKSIWDDYETVIETMAKNQ